MDIERQDRQCHGAFKPLGPVGAHPIKPPMFQIVDRRFHRRMLTARCLEGGCVLAFAVGLGEPTLARQAIVFQLLVEFPSVVGTVKAAVEAASDQFRIHRLGLGDQGNRHRCIAALPENPVMPNKLQWIFHEGHRHPRPTGLAFRDLAGVRFKDREDLFSVGDLLAVQ